MPSFQENARLEELHMEKIRERIRYLEAQEQATQDKRERGNQLMRNDLNTQVGLAMRHSLAGGDGGNSKRGMYVCGMTEV